MEDWNKNTLMFKNKYFNRIIFFSIILIILSILVYHTMVIISDIKTPWNLRLVGSQDGWLSFSGALIGGLLTMSGVMLTLQDQDQHKKVDKILEYKPIIKFLGLDLKDNYVNLLFQNKGRGEALIENFSVTLDKIPKKFDFIIDSEIMCCDEQLYFPINYVDILNEEKDLSVTINYKNYNSSIVYTLTFTSKITWNLGVINSQPTIYNHQHKITEKRIKF